MAMPESWTNTGRSLLIQSLDVDGAGKTVAYRNFPGGSSDDSQAPKYVKETQGSATLKTGSWGGLNNTGYLTRLLLYARSLGTSHAAIFLPDNTQVTSTTSFTNADWQFLELPEYVPSLGICGQAYELRVWGSETHLGCLTALHRPTPYDIVTNVISSALVSTNTFTDVPSTYGGLTANLTGAPGEVALATLVDDGLPSVYIPLARTADTATAFPTAGYGTHWGGTFVDYEIPRDGTVTGGVMSGATDISQLEMLDVGQVEFIDGSWEALGHWVQTSGSDFRRTHASPFQLSTGHTYRLGVYGGGTAYDVAQLYRCFEIRACAEFLTLPPATSSGSFGITFDDYDLYTGGTADVDHFELVITDLNDCPVQDINPVTSPYTVSGLSPGSYAVAILAVMADGSFCYDQRNTVVTSSGQIIRYR